MLNTGDTVGVLIRATLRVALIKVPLPSIPRAHIKTPSDHSVAALSPPNFPS